ncbi:MAG: potassium transporter Kup [Thermoanaerobaculia bacterium]
MSQSESTPGVDLQSTSHAPVIRSPKDLARLGLGAVGVVYGDIGTSPLYAIKECFTLPHGVAINLGNVLGILSLVFWALTLIVVVKYIGYVMRADNHGDGGILALLALVTEQRSHPKRGESGHRRWITLVALALFGAALLWADGMITPVISVLGALEGLDVATPILRPWIVPLALVILISLFLVQKRGTAGIGAVFGPLMLVWFASIAALGIPAIARHPEVLAAANPIYALAFFRSNGLHGFLILGSVVLCVTGSEALYADMGHFGRRPIRVAWFVIVFPALLANYFGQGALLLSHGYEVVENPFFGLAPSWFLYPLVAIATVAAVIASQALISGAFSLAQQAIQLGFSPRMTIVHTSTEASGQIYVPEVNTILMVACIALTLVFQKSGNLAAAYGIAVMGTMVITTILLFSVERRIWNWPLWQALALCSLFMVVDIPFLLANVVKIVSGGWVPLAVAAVIYVLMTTWNRGRAAVRKQLEGGSLPLALFLTGLEEHEPHRVKGTAVFMTSVMGVAPPGLLHHFKHNRILHETVIIFTIVTEGIPEVPKRDRIEVRVLAHGFSEVVAHYGFMQTPNVPLALRRAAEMGLKFNPDAVSYFLGRETLLTTGKSGMARWRKSLFVYLALNARPANAFFRIPPNRVIELGAQVEI